MDNNMYPVVCFGEVLWDILPSGAEPGGAPMNVAYHLHQHQKSPALITKIGDDAEGQRLLTLFKSKGIATNYIETDTTHETGKVYATQDAKGDMTYDIVQPSAWDFINWQDAFTGLMADASYFVYGSLAARNTQSRKTLFELLQAAPQKVLDINLRAPHYDKNILTELLSKADILKMNEDELAFISPWYSSHTTLEDRMKSITEQLNLSLFVVTKGGNGAMLFTEGRFFSHPGYKVRVADTVGSGDAFLAATLANLLDNEPPGKILEKAVKLGSFVATQKGAMPGYDILEVESAIGG